MPSHQWIEKRANFKLYDENGKLHNPNGPAAIATHTNNIFYLFHGVLHRVNGPAIIWNQNRYDFYQNGVLHNEIGPARVTLEKHAYFINGQIHRDDGPAIIRFKENNYEIWEYYQNGKFIKKELARFGKLLSFNPLHWKIEGF